VEVAGCAKAGIKVYHVTSKLANLACQHWPYSVELPCQCVPDALAQTHSGYLDLCAPVFCMFWNLRDGEFSATIVHPGLSLIHFSFLYACLLAYWAYFCMEIGLFFFFFHLFIVLLVFIKPDAWYLIKGQHSSSGFVILIWPILITRAKIDLELRIYDSAAQKRHNFYSWAGRTYQ